MVKFSELFEAHYDNEANLVEKLLMIKNGAKYGQIVFMSGGAGCYPGYTEYFTKNGWKRLDEFTEDVALVFDPRTGEAFFDDVEHVKLPVDSFTRIKNRRVDFTTSFHHKHLVVNEKTGEYEVELTKELCENHFTKKRGNKRSFVKAFQYNGEGINYSDDYIRLKVAVFADGHFMPKRKNVCRVSLKKDRKIERLKDLLASNGIEYREYNENEYTRFEFTMDSDDKEFGVEWYRASSHQLKIIVDECLYWDGSISLREDRKTIYSFTTTSEKSKDFIQFAAAALGLGTRIHVDNREGRTVCYSVYLNKNPNVGFSKNQRSATTTEFSKVYSEDGMMYCLTTNTGFFVVRQHGEIYVSGNSGKGFVGGQFMEGERYKVRDVDELKKQVLKLSEIKGKFPEVKGLNLKVPADVGKLHMFVKEKGFNEKGLDGLLRDLSSDRLPNILFDITGKSNKDFLEYIPALVEVGYDLSNMHIVWVMTDYRVAYYANLDRDRVVPDDILLQTHDGAAKTMQAIIDSKKMPGGMNGAFYVVLNNRERTKFFKIGDEYKGKTVTSLPLIKKGKDAGKTMNIVKGFEYIVMKRAGGAWLKPNEHTGDFMQKLADAINANVPKEDAKEEMAKVKVQYLKDQEEKAKKLAAKK